MSLQVTLTLCGSEQPADVGEMSQSFGPEGGSIGRSVNNDWVLPDPHLSKTHCFVGFRDGAFTITDVSTNGLYFNSEEQRVARGETRPLQDGDTLRMGEYRIQVSLRQMKVDEAVGAASDIAPEEEDDFAALLSGGAAQPSRAAEDNPFGTPDSFDPPPSLAPAPTSKPSAAASSEAAQDDISDLLGEAGGVARGPAGPGGIPEDYDPLAGSFDDDDLGDRPTGEAWTRAAEPDHVPAEAQYFTPPQVGHQEAPASSAGQIPEDWFLDEEKAPNTPHAPPPPPRTVPPEGPARPSSAPPRRPRPGGSVAGGDAILERSHDAPAEADALFRAFLEGAGLEAAADMTGREEELLRAVGASYREMVRGLCELLRVRQSIKNEFRLEKTVIQSNDNNPLKFAVTPEEAVRALLYPAEAGYLKADAAISESIDDLKAHQLAVMAGLQVALASLLQNFDPTALEQRLQDSSLWGNILPGAKKARYWEVFTELYKEIAQEAESNFYGLFGQAFARAYEEQINRLKAKQ